MPFVEDMSPFFQATEFAFNATLNGVEVRGIFDNGSQDFEVGPGVFATGPVFLLPTVDVPSAVSGLSIIIDGVNWKIADHEPDGTGLTLLRLRKA